LSDKSGKLTITTGLTAAVNLLEPIKKQFPLISYADLFQLASATAIETVRLCRTTFNRERPPFVRMTSLLCE
jgi:catalase (peroxidase I)